MEGVFSACYRIPVGTANVGVALHYEGFPAGLSSLELARTTAPPPPAAAEGGDGYWGRSARVV